MKILKAQAAYLTNYEVYTHLASQKSDLDSLREIHRLAFEANKPVKPWEKKKSKQKVQDGAGAGVESKEERERRLRPLAEAEEKKILEQYSAVRATENEQRIKDEENNLLRSQLAKEDWLHRQESIKSTLTRDNAQRALELKDEKRKRLTEAARWKNRRMGNGLSLEESGWVYTDEDEEREEKKRRGRKAALGKVTRFLYGIPGDTPLEEKLRWWGKVETQIWPDALKAEEGLLDLLMQDRESNDHLLTSEELSKFRQDLFAGDAYYKMKETAALAEKERVRVEEEARKKRWEREEKERERKVREEVGWEARRSVAGKEEWNEKRKVDNNVAYIVDQTFDYLNNPAFTTTRRQSPEYIDHIVSNLSEMDFTKPELLNVINFPPGDKVVLNLVVEEMWTRWPEDHQTEKILQICQEYLEPDYEAQALAEQYQANEGYREDVDMNGAGGYDDADGEGMRGVVRAGGDFVDEADKWGREKGDGDDDE